MDALTIGDLTILKKSKKQRQKENEVGSSSDSVVGGRKNSQNGARKLSKETNGCLVNELCCHILELQNLLPVLEKHLDHLLQKQEEAKNALHENDDLPAFDDTTSRTEAKYPKRNVTRVNYTEEDISDDDDYLYCDDCEKEYKGQCPMHEPLQFIPNTEIPRDGSVPDRAFSSIPDFLSLGVSKIKGAGYGIWTEIDLPKGLVFGPYEGTAIKNHKEAHKSGYCWQIKKCGKIDHYVEAGDISTSNWMRFVNCAKTEQMQNLIAFQYKGQIYYRTYKPVLKYCELLVWYGESYAKELNINLNDDGEEIANVTSHSYYKCEKCDVTFSAEKYLKGHMKKHGDNISSFRHKCHICPYSSTKRTNLECHLLTHTGERPHTCPQCGKGFSREYNLKTHLRCHSGERPHHCDVCNKAFSLKHALEAHRRSHFNERPFVCDVCSKAFIQMSHLTLHQRTHTGQQPFTCPHCNQRFNRSMNLHRHVIQKHTRSFPHKCLYCEKGFVAPSQLQKHKRKCHCQIEE